MYKLTYFDIPFRGEPARLILAAAGVNFIDNRVQFADWPALKSTLEWGQLPLLELDDRKLTQSKTIYRYLAHKFNLAGKDEWESARCDELIDAMSDLVEEFAAIKFKPQDAAQKEERKQNFFNTTLPTFLNRVSKLLKENGETWLVGKNMTWADITIAEFLRQFCEINPNALNGHPHIKKMQEAVDANERIEKYRKSTLK